MSRQLQRVGNGSDAQARLLRDTAPRKQQDKEEKAQNTSYTTEKQEDIQSDSTIRIWWYEMVCCVIVIGALASNVGMLIAYHGQPLPKWRFGLSLNAFSAMLVTVLKTSAVLILSESLSHMKWTALRKSQPLSHIELYDDASRGLIGVAGLLRTIGWKSWLPGLGSLVTLLLLPIDAFSQQLISTSDCRMPVWLPASLDRIQNYNTSTDNLDFLSALSLGIWSPKVRAPLSFDCASGNCTFNQPYHAIGLYANCSDISDQLIIEIADGENDANGIPPNQIITLPRYIPGRFAAMPPNLTLFAEPSAMRLLHTNPFAKPTRFAAGLSGQNTAFVDMINFSDDFVPKAYSCGFDACVRSYNATVEAGQLRENLLPNGEIRSIRSLSNLNCIRQVNPSVLEIFRNLGYVFDDGMRFLPYEFHGADFPSRNASISFETYQGLSPTAQRYYDVEGIAPEPNSTPSFVVLKEEITDAVPLECHWSIDSDFFTGLRQIYEVYFTGEVLDTTTMVNVTGASPLLQVYNSGSGNRTLEDVSLVWQSMADSISAFMRTHGQLANLSQPAQGTAWQQSVCMRIRWPWVAYPVTVTLLLLAFFIPMIQHTSRAHRRLQKEWGRDATSAFGFKASLLPLLFNGLSDADKEKLLKTVQNRSNINVLRSRAKDVKVHLHESSEGGWRLKLE